MAKVIAIMSKTPDIQVVVFEVTPGKAYGHAKGDPFSQTNYPLRPRATTQLTERAS